MVDQKVNIQQFSSDSVSQDVTSGVTWLSSYVTDCEDTSCEWCYSVFYKAHHI